MESTRLIPSKLAKLLTNKRLRPWLLAALAGAIITEIVALSPSPLEETTGVTKSLEPETLVADDQAVLAPGIPKNRVPEYTVEKFNDVSSTGTVKQWNLVADRAFLYNAEKLVHARQVKAQLYDPNGQATVITGKEAKYFMNKRDLEIFGDVKTIFPDGFELHSEYLRYMPNERRVEIPVTYPVRGQGQPENGKSVSFTSRGLNFAMGQSEITLPEQVFFRMDETQPTAKNKELESTTIESDHCVIHRDRQLAFFTMKPARKEPERFVRISQNKLRARGRRANLNYGDFAKLLHYMTIEQDVTVRELPGQGVDAKDARWGTGGRADFDSRRDLIILSEYPQVYQGDDTITGDIILVHRDTDVVEVENSNAFSQGTTEPGEHERSQ